jgi:hypothetical protein
MPSEARWTLRRLRALHPGLHAHRCAADPARPGTRRARRSRSPEAATATAPRCSSCSCCRDRRSTGTGAGLAALPLVVRRSTCPRRERRAQPHPPQRGRRPHPAGRARPSVRPAAARRRDPAIDTAGSDAEPEVELRVLRLTDAQRCAPRSSRTQRPSVGDAASGPAAAARPRPAATLSAGRRRSSRSRSHASRSRPSPACSCCSPLRCWSVLLQLAGERVDELIARPSTVAARAARAGCSPERHDLGARDHGRRGRRLGRHDARGLGRARWGLRRERVGDDLVLRRGLLGTRESTVPLRRVQVVRVTANPLRRVLGVASVRIHSAGGSGGGEGGERRVVIPLVASDELGRLLAELLPGSTTLPGARARIRWPRDDGRSCAACVACSPGSSRRRSAGRCSSRWPTGGTNLRVPDRPALLARDGVRMVGAAPRSAVLVVAWCSHVAEHRALAHGHDRHVVAARHGTRAHAQRRPARAPAGRDAARRAVPGAPRPRDGARARRRTGWRRRRARCRRRRRRAAAVGRARRDRAASGA